MSTDTHGTRLVVWDVPDAVECGTAFHVKVAVKCAHECSSAGRVLEVRDHGGQLLASAPAGDEPWPSTTALHAAELKLQAPANEGHYAWEARVSVVAAPAQGVEHEPASERFTVRAVAAAECLIRITAVDAESQAPVAGAKVVAHPYRSFTDANGKARIRVPRGDYRLFVSGRDYFPFRYEGGIVTDMTIRAELFKDVGPSDAELWS